MKPARAPALFYADWVHSIPGDYARLKAYRQRLLARSSIARVVAEARPFRLLSRWVLRTVTKGGGEKWYPKLSYACADRLAPPDKDPGRLDRKGQAG